METFPMSGRLYTMREACSLLGVHPNTLRRWDREGKIKVVRLGKGHRRIPEDEITRVLTKLPTQVSHLTSQEIMRQNLRLSFLTYVFSYHRNDWDLMRKAILIRDEYSCAKCGGKEFLEIHHKDGTGRNDPENLVTLCQKCHKEIHKSVPKQKTSKIEPKAPTKPPEKPKTETRPDKVPSGEEELPRHTILDELAPAGLSQRTAFGDLLSAAMALRSFALEEISTRARCPVPIAKIFCERMSARGYLLDKDGRYELRVKVARSTTPPEGRGLSLR